MGALSLAELPVLSLWVVGGLVGVVEIQVVGEPSEEAVIGQIREHQLHTRDSLECGIGEEGLSALLCQLVGVRARAEELVHRLDEAAEHA